MASKVRSEGISVDTMVSEFEQKLERLRVLYEQFFMGIEKRQPTILHHDVVRVMVEIDKQRIHNHRVRYRYRSLVARFNTYRTYWGRTLRAIDNGTYHRDLARLRRKWKDQGLDVQMPTRGRMKNVTEVEKAIATAVRQAQEGKTQQAPAMVSPKRQPVPTDIRGRAADDLRQEMDRHVPGQEPAADPRPMEPPPAPPFAAAASGGDLSPRGTRVIYRPASPVPTVADAQAPQGMSEAQMQSIFRRYVKAKRMVGEDPGNVRYESLVRTIDNQLPKLQEMAAGKQVDFDVVIKKGKVVLKAKTI